MPNGVTVVDPAAGVLGQAFGELGEALAGLINKKEKERKKRFKELTEDLGRAEQVAEAFRRAGDDPEAQANFARFLGVDLEDIQELSKGLQPTGEELARTKSREVGLPGEQVEAALGEAKVKIETTTQTLGSGVIEAEIKAATLQAQVDLLENQGVLDSDVIPLEIQARRAIAERVQLEETFGAKVFKLRSVGGLAELQVDAEVMETQLRANLAKFGKDKLGLEKDSLRTFEAAKASLPNTPEGNAEREAMAAAIISPAWLNYLINKANIDARTLAVESSLTRDPVKRLETLDKFLSATQEAQDRFNEAEGKDSEIAAASDLQGLFRLGQELIQAGSMPTMDLTLALKIPKRVFGEKFRLIKMKAITPSLEAELIEAAEMVLNGQNTLEELKAEPALREALSEEQQKQFFSEIEKSLKEKPLEEEEVETRPEAIPPADGRGGIANLFGGSFGALSPQVKADLGIVDGQSKLDVFLKELITGRPLGTGR